MLVQINIFTDILRWWATKEYLPTFDFDGSSKSSSTSSKQPPRQTPAQLPSCPTCLRVLPLSLFVKGDGRDVCRACRHFAEMEHADVNHPALLLPLYAGAWHRLSTSSTFKFAPAVNQILLDVYETLADDSDITLAQRRWFSICDMVYQGLSVESISKQIDLRFPRDDSCKPPPAGSGTAVLLDVVAHNQYDVLSKIASKVRFGRPVHETYQKRKKLAEDALEAAKKEEGRFPGTRNTKFGPRVLPPRGKGLVCRICHLGWDDERAIGTRRQNIHLKNSW